MRKKGIKFNPNDQPEFVAELRGKINQYFKENELSKHANNSMRLKTAFMLALYFIPLVLIVTQVVSGLALILLMYVLMGFGMAGIGTCVMHDANHGAYSKNKLVNKALGFTANFIGAYHINWKIQHNVLHHSYTNIAHYDEDIDKKGIIRFSPHQKSKKGLRFQAFYAPILYSIMTIYWLFGKDFEQLFRYNKEKLLKAQGITFQSGLIYMAINKIWYLGLILALPLLVSGAVWWHIVLGFVMMQLMSGLLLALIFQSAHVIEETDFYEADEHGSVENNWAIHQMRTTSNFAHGSGVFSWLIGGLNYQIEHHLFPNICHCHYKKMSPIVKATAEAHDIPYHHHKSFFKAIKSHFSLLHTLGKHVEPAR
jgi:linoleoyl-CoA desaturase